MSARLPAMAYLEHEGAPFTTLEGAFRHAERVFDRTGQRQRIALRIVGQRSGYRHRRWIVTPGLLG